MPAEGKAARDYPTRASCWDRVDRARLSEFLRSRRDARQPEEVGLPRGQRRRAPGLRRDEVAELSGISTHYYTRIEQPRGPVPSPQVLKAIAGALRLPPAERDHLLRLAGHAPGWSGGSSRAVSPGLRRIFDRLQGEPALVASELGEALLQTPSAIALLGDESSFTGMMRSRAFRWFTDPSARQFTPPEDHGAHSRVLVAHLAAASVAGAQRSEAQAMVDALTTTSDEFERLWREQPVAPHYCDTKRIRHPEVGELELHGQTLVDPHRRQLLTIFTAEPGTESARRLSLLTEGRTGLTPPA